METRRRHDQKWSRLVAIGLALVSFGSCTSANTQVSAPAVVATIPVPTTTPLTSTTSAASPTSRPQPTTLPDASATTTPPPGPTSTGAPALRTQTGAEVLAKDNFGALRGLNVGLITHQPSQVNGERLADLLHANPDVELVALFAPEHGIDGSAAAGAAIDNTVDASTQTRVFSLYGLDRSPDDGTLVNVDVLVYDLQDAGSRFFTYTSTLGLSMQAAAQANIPFVVLDRPNPLGGALQGPLLAPGNESFIGLYPVPSAYGLTSGELALAIQEHRWLDGLEGLDLRIVPLENWSRDLQWSDTGQPWIPPSPNLPTANSALLYPGTVLFEATSISEGRGTNDPFLTIGAPWIDANLLTAEMAERQLPGVRFEAITVAPRSVPGAAPNPKYLGEQIHGVHIIITDAALVTGFDIGVELLDAILRQGESRGITSDQIIDRPGVFDRLAGTVTIRQDLLAARPVAEIAQSAAVDHQAFAELIAGELLYD